MFMRKHGICSLPAGKTFCYPDQFLQGIPLTLPQVPGSVVKHKSILCHVAEIRQVRHCPEILVQQQSIPLTGGADVLCQQVSVQLCNIR